MSLIFDRKDREMYDPSNPKDRLRERTLWLMQRIVDDHLSSIDLSFKWFPREEVAKLIIRIFADVVEFARVNDIVGDTVSGLLCNAMYKYLDSDPDKRDFMKYIDEQTVALKKIVNDFIKEDK